MTPPLITLEEHFFAEETSESTYEAYSEQFKHVAGLEEQLRDLADVRLRDMDAGKISMQVISHGPVPGGPGLEESIKINDQLHKAVSSHPSRFAGFATLSMANPDAAAKELRRAVKELGFVGALIDCHVHGKFYDGDEYLTFWQTAEELDVPIYIHPTWAPESLTDQYTGNFTQGAARSLAASGFGWHSQTALHVLRLYASFLFDKVPRLKIIIGHFGEMLPFMKERVCQLSRRWGDHKRDFKTVYEENLWITTSGVWSLAPMGTILMNTPIDHILYSIDYPLAKNDAGLDWIEKLESSGMVTAEQLNQIAYQNAEKLLRIKVA